ncbi:MAG: DNA mismatch endonuclease Vsr [Sedimentisphaerales bacterium]|nr:DNA mismatch endonuclease Vsr [Sedimentisphaerales bacterium]
MSRVKNRRTKPEEIVADILKSLGTRYRRNVKRLPGQPDFVIHSAQTAIFVNGCFWHGHRNCVRAKLPATNRSFWEHKINKNKRRDRRVRRLLRQQGWKTLTIWQCRLRRVEQIKQRLIRALSKRTG